MTARDALHVAVQGGCKNLGRDDIGQIAPGFAADLVAFPTNKLAFAGAQHDVVAAVVFCSPGADQVSLVLDCLHHAVPKSRSCVLHAQQDVQSLKSAARRSFTHDITGRGA